MSLAALESIARMEVHIRAMADDVQAIRRCVEGAAGAFEKRLGELPIPEEAVSELLSHVLHGIREEA